MKDTLVIVNLRGAVDGLNAVVPYREGAYYDARPTIAVPPPGARGRTAIDLDGRFALHPSLAPLVPHWERGELAIVHAIGWPGDAHSHFEAWDEIESGATGDARPRSGWVARLVAASPTRPVGPMRAVAFADTMPRLFTGVLGASVMQALPSELVGGDAARERRARAGLRTLYAGDALGRPGLAALDAFEAVAALDASNSEPSPYPSTTFGGQMRSIERLLRADVGLEVASAELFGWDTHFAQGGAEGAMSERLAELAAGLAAFVERQRDVLDRLTIVVLSEFGRRLAENGSGGTDHGRGGIAFALGGRVRGGRVYGEWPGLAADRLVDPGDLAATSDVRDLLGELVTLRAGTGAAAACFPGYQPRAPLGVFA